MVDVPGLAGRLGEPTVVLEPERFQPEWWAGAPSVVYDSATETWYLAARMRHSLSPKGRRGYEIRILRSNDGIAFESIASIRREELPVYGFERPSLVRDRTGRFRLFLCGCLEAYDGKWGVLTVDAVADPADFDSATHRVVLPPTLEPNPRGYKDPFILPVGEELHMFVIGTGYVERAYHLTSADGGERWGERGEQPWFDVGGWHNFYTRPACVLPMSVGYLVVYEGSHSLWNDPVYNIATGLAYSLDLEEITDLTPYAPVLESPAVDGEYRTWRYSHWLRVGDWVHVFAEVAYPDLTNRLVVYRFPAD